MKSEWPRVKLEEVLIEVSRPESVIPNKKYQRLGMRWYAQGLFIKDKVEGKEIKAAKVYRIELGDFVYNRLFAWKGSFGVAQPEHHGAYVSNEFPCFRIDESRLDPDFLWFFFSRPSIWEHIKSRSTGASRTSRLRFKQADFLNLTLSLPPLEEQQSLIAVMDVFSTRIKEAKELLAESTKEIELLRSIDLSKVIRHQSVKYPQKPLKEIVNIVGGGTPSRKNATYWGGEIPWVTPKDMKTLFIDDSQEKITPLGLQESSTKLIKPEAVLVVFRSRILAHTLPIAVSTKPLTINQDLKALLPNKEVLPRYLALVLKGKEKEILSQVKGGDVAVLSIKNHEFVRLQIPVPPVEVQQQIIQRDFLIRDKQKTIQNELSLLDTNWSSLLSSMIDQLSIGSKVL